MRVKCKFNTGSALLEYERSPLGVSKESTYGLLDIGEEYLVMGMILADGFLLYLLDNAGVVSACPSRLFESQVYCLPKNWYFKTYDENSASFSGYEAIWGYYELVYDSEHYTGLVETDDAAFEIYFKRKEERLKNMNNE